MTGSQISAADRRARANKPGRSSPMKIRIAVLAVALAAVAGLGAGWSPASATDLDHTTARGAATASNEFQDVCYFVNPNVNSYVVNSWRGNAYIANPNPIQNANGQWVTHQHLTDDCRYFPFASPNYGIICVHLDRHNNPPPGGQWNEGDFYAC